MSEPDQAMSTDDYRDSHKSSGGHYDQTIFSSPFDAYMDKQEARALTRALSRFFPDGVPRYLDFACGTGRITQRVEPSAKESVGVDVSETMLAVARDKCPRTRFVCADITREDLDLGLFDLVTSFRFFGNAQDDLRSSVLSAINRRLRPGGYLIINNHRNPQSFLGIASQATAEGKQLDLSHAKLKALLRRHGFEIAFQRAIGFWIFRFKLTTSGILESAPANWLERAFARSWFAPFSPDALIVARKIGGAGG
jgi:SAM-dependent methyltransferase